MNRDENYSKVVFEIGQDSGGFDEKLNEYYPGVVFIYDLETNTIRYVNSRVVSLLSFSPEDILKDGNLANLIYHEDLDLISNKIAELLALRENEELSFPCRLHHKTETCRHFAVTARILEWNKTQEPAAILFMCNDINERVKIQKEREEMAELFRDTEELLQFGSWSWDIKTDNMEWTQGMYDIAGFGRGEIAPMSGSFYLQLVSGDDKEKVGHAIEDAIITHSGFELDYVLKTKSGEEKSVFTKGKAIVNSKGEVKKVVGITRDITSLKNLERERERTIKELNRSNKELEEFAYVASHDLQEPLRKIATFNERLKMKFGEILGTDGMAYLDRIISSTDNMRMLIDNLLEFSRITRSSQAFCPCDLNLLVRDAISDQELKIEETGCVIHVSYLPPIEAVPMEIKQLFTNLISNAIKFRKKDATPIIMIKAERATKTEKNRYHLPLEKNYLRVEVKDNGIGFEEEYSERIFQIFQRLHGKTEYAGSGIGLAICKKIVDNHEGIIFASGKPGMGSMFTIMLPEKQLT
jgi:PAS domain S-box-containing protein